MSSVRGALAVSALALSIVIASTPARSASTSVIGTVVKQSAPIAIESCSAEVDGDAFTPAIVLAPDARVVVSQSYRLTFLDATGKVTGHASVTPPYSAGVADGGGFAQLRCAVEEMRLDDGSSFSNAPPQRDPHGFVNAFIGVGLLAAGAFLASRHTNNAPAPSNTDLDFTPEPTAVPSGVATVAASPSAVPTAIRLSTRRAPEPAARH